MSRKLKTFAALNILGWIVVVPLLATALLEPFVNFGDWPGGFLTDRNGGSAQLADPGRGGNGRGGGGDGDDGAGGTGQPGDGTGTGSAGTGAGGTLPGGGPAVPGGPGDGTGGPGGNGGNGNGGNGNGPDGPPDAVYSAPMVEEVDIQRASATRATAVPPLQRRFPRR